MIFSIVGRCAETGQPGVAISSSSTAVDTRCSWLRAGTGAVTMQNITLSALDPQILDRLNQGLAPGEALDQALSSNSYDQYRQVAVIDQHGRTALFTGREALGVHHARAGEQYVAVGNLLAAPEVIEAMVDAFESVEGLFAERLLAATGAALAAGGEAGPVHSAALSVVGDLLWPVVDLRADRAEHNPIGQPERLQPAYKPQMQDYVTRALDPTRAPSYGVSGDE